VARTHGHRRDQAVNHEPFVAADAGLHLALDCLLIRISDELMVKIVKQLE
jgi:hypothetical protein